MRTLRLADTIDLPVLGLGTWRMGEVSANRSAEVRAIRRAIEMGYRLFDTAEMYGEGGAETVLGLAMAEALRAGDVRRDELTIVSKVYPHNASRQGTSAACDRSRQRLALDVIDLYLLHWHDNHPPAYTVSAMRELRSRGAIRTWGVSNFDVNDMLELAGLHAVPRPRAAAVNAAGVRTVGVADVGAAATAAASAVASTAASTDDCVCNQVYLSPTERGAEFALLPWLQQHGQVLMAYSPVDQGELAQSAALRDMSRRLGVSPTRLGLAWLLSRPGVCVIPKASQEVHQRDNLAAADLVLGAAELAELENAFPAPRRKAPLAMI
ncbi:MAG: aldo/keto reductase [Burkholderiales bacterium]|nr:aldo/keto reductase [Burkholderiales bacterium]